MKTDSFKTELCKCNNCETIMVDENPQVGAKRYLVRDGKTHLNEVVEQMERLDDMGTEFWGCPNCLTDEYLTDL